MGPLLEQVFSAEEFRHQGHQIIDLLADYLEAAAQPSTDAVMPWMPPGKGEQHWADDFADHAGQPISTLLAKVLEEGIHLHTPRYMGHQISPPAPAAALAGLLNDFMNNGMGVYEMGIPGSVLERQVVKVVARQMGFGENADGVLTSGGSLANLTALLTARSIKAPENIWQVGTGGEQLALLVSEEAHYCVDRAVRIMGWGAAGIIKVPADDQYRMRTELLPSCLAEAKAAGKRVIAVVGSACSTATGSFDDLQAIGQFAQQHNLWFHVDGAHGAACAFSRKYRKLVAGIELADSIAMDFHKMLLTPSVTTALLYRNSQDSYHTFAQKAQYLWEKEGEQEWHNLARRTFECTKTMLSLRAYSLIRTYGIALFDEYVTQVNDCAQAFAALLQKRPGWDLAIHPACNIVCFRYAPQTEDEATNDFLNQQMRKRLVEEGSFYIVQTVLRERIYLRVTLSSPYTQEADLVSLLDRLEVIAKAIPTVV